MATIDFVVSGNRIATESFAIGKIYEIIFTDGSFLICACNHVGNNFVVFQRELPELLFTLNMETASSVRSIEETGGGGGTYNYSDLENKPQINSVELSGNKSSSDLGLQSALNASQLDAVNSGITAAKVATFEGKQDAITSDSKLSADLVDDVTTANKFVTAADKTTWNAKQNALTFDDAPTQNSSNPVKSGGIYTALSGKQDTIDNLAAIESGAAAGATAVQPGILDSALALKQNALTTAQLAAVNSGITSEDVAQIETNKNNILKKQNILLYTDRNNATTYSFNGLTSISDNTKFRYGILIGGGTDSNPGKAMIWFVFVGTSEISFFKIIGDGAQTLTGSISDDVLTITSSATIYGGLRLIWLA